MILQADREWFCKQIENVRYIRSHFCSAASITLVLVACALLMSSRPLYDASRGGTPDVSCWRPGRPINLSWDKEDVDVLWPFYDVKAYHRRRVCSKAIKRIVRAFKKEISWPARIKLMKSYMDLPHRRGSDWFTCPNEYVFDEFVAAAYVPLTKLLELKKPKESVEDLGDGDVRTEEPARGKKRPIEDLEAPPLLPVAVRPVASPLRCPYFVIDLTSGSPDFDSSQPCSEPLCVAFAVGRCDNCWLWHCEAHLGPCAGCGRGPFCPVCAIPINHTCVPPRPVPQDPHCAGGVPVDS